MLNLFCLNRRAGALTLHLLVKTIKNKLVKKYELFVVKIIQIYYNDNYDVYQPIKEEIITDKVAN